ncbi:MAG: hypothetical protein LBL13_07690 [Bacteroidales bacterium]|jgi:hypothetical protein|nr:hypothetical protein [Bacteroidales bacterium]
MKEKILALLETKFQGKRKDGLNRLASAIALQVTTEDEANTIVGRMTAESVDSFIAEWRREADTEISKANRTYEDGLKKKYDFVEKKQPEVTTPPVTTTVAVEDGKVDMAALQKIFGESIEKVVKPLQETIASLKGEKTKETRLRDLNGKLTECKDENFKNMVLKSFPRMQFDTDEAFTEYLTEVETDVKTANQKAADSGLGAQGRPIVSNPSGGKDATDAEISAVMDLLPI